MEPSRESKRDAGPAGAAARSVRVSHESALPELRENVNVPSPPSSPAESSIGTTGTEQQLSSTAKERFFAHSAALRRLNGSKPQKPTATDSTSTANTQPVLVHPDPRTEEDWTMRRSRRKSTLVPSTDLPPLSSFSFQDILKEIDQEVTPSLDAIAEIFGRSKLSLADEYGSHLPPQGELSFPATPGQNEILGAIPNPRLEPVEEATPGHKRRQSLALVGVAGSTTQKSNAVAATSTTSVESAAGGPRRETDSEADTQASLLPYVVSWLRSSHAKREPSSRRSSVDPRASESLQKILGES